MGKALRQAQGERNSYVPTCTKSTEIQFPEWHRGKRNKKGIAPANSRHTMRRAVGGHKAQFFLFFYKGVCSMKTNRHNTSLPDDVLAQISAKIGEVEDLLLPHTHTLTPKERQKLVKMGDKSLAFVKKANEYAKTLPAIVPA
ncbi:MAG: hypothetical protein LBI68_07040, partial [Azoarcus sp.]|nr:hypothetical protein [Azoarcus sp.]